MEILSTEVKRIYDVFAAKLQPSLVEFYKNASKEHIAFVKTFESRHKKLIISLELAKDLSEKVERQREFKKGLLDLLAKQSSLHSESSFEEFYADFVELANKELAELKPIVQIKEPFQGYSISLKGNPFITLRKIVFNTKRSVILFFKRFTNVFRRNPIEVAVYKKRRVLLRSMAKEFILNQFLENSTHLVSELMGSQSKGLIELWKLDEALDVDFQKILDPDNSTVDSEQEERESPLDIFRKVKEEHQAVVKSIVSDVETIGQDAFLKFDEAFQKVDTLNLRYNYFGANGLALNKKRVLEFYDSELQRWANTHTALFDDWSVDVEITLLYYSVFDEFNYLNENIDDYISKTIKDSFKKIKAFIAKSQKAIETAGTSKKTVKDIIVAERNSISTQLIDKILTQSIENLNGCFTNDFETLRKDTINLVNQVSDHRGFIRNKKYLNGVSTSEIKYISPRELLNYEALPEFKKRVNEVEFWVDAQLEKVRINVIGLGTVCDFTLESAHLILEQKSGTSKVAVETAVDGFDRALVHLQKAEAILKKIQTTIKKDLSAAINEFDDDILKLKNTHNLFELNFKIARIKAIERTQMYKEKLVTLAKQVIPKSIEFVRVARARISEKKMEIKFRLGILEQKNYISFELSEFIVQAQQSLKNLPFVYQRLYQLSPANEERFFVDRENELGQLTKALANWQKDRFITVAIIGEKGSGITSLINIFLKKTEIKMEILSHTLDCKIYSNQAYFSLFGKLFGVEKFESNEQIINFINNSDGSRMVVLENLQHLFLKQVNGFDCMNMLFELMAHTMKKVLWVGAYTTHSWNYLDRTIHISNYFTNEVYVQQMNMVAIEQIIYKRNRLSGFQIVFQPHTLDLTNKKFMKLDEREKQRYLRHKFFSTLHRISSGNITLAQLYWLQSTQLTNDEDIQISPIREIDFTFVKNLTGDELFALQAMIIHDGLDIENFAMIMGKPISSSRNLLTPMLEKGLLIRPKLKYNINPIIFRPVANYLASRNFVN